MDQYLEIYTTASSFFSYFTKIVYILDEIRAIAEDKRYLQTLEDYFDIFLAKYPDYELYTTYVKKNVSNKYLQGDMSLTQKMLLVYFCRCCYYFSSFCHYGVENAGGGFERILKKFPLLL